MSTNAAEPDLPHGLKRYRDKDTQCRCDICRDAQAQDIFEARGRRYAQRIDVGGRLVAILPPQAHGRPSSYVNWGCRCEPCTRAHSTRHSAWRSKQREPRPQ